MHPLAGCCISNCQIYSVKTLTCMHSQHASVHHVSSQCLRHSSCDYFQDFISDCGRTLKYLDFRYSSRPQIIWPIGCPLNAPCCRMRGGTSVFRELGVHTMHWKLSRNVSYHSKCCQATSFYELIDRNAQQ